MSHFSIIGTPLYQWEKGRKLQIVPLSGMRVDSVHFSNYGDSIALVVEPKEKDGVYIAEIPNILLCDDKNIVVYSVNVSEDKTETLRECVFAVRKRAKPSDYVYTETEIRSYEALEKRILDLEKESATVDQTYNPESENAQSGKAVAEAVSDKPTIYKGTDFFIVDPTVPRLATACQGTVPYKIGDLYFNTNEKRYYIFTNVEYKNEFHITNVEYEGLNYPISGVFDAESGFPQSGKAVKEAINETVGDINSVLATLVTVEE